MDRRTVLVPALVPPPAGCLGSSGEVPSEAAPGDPGNDPDLSAAVDAVSSPLHSAGTSRLARTLWFNGTFDVTEHA